VSVQVSNFRISEPAKHADPEHDPGAIPAAALLLTLLSSRRSAQSSQSIYVLSQNIWLA